MSLPVMERAARYLEKCPAAVSGQNGHNAAFHAAAVLVHGFALGEEEALDLLRQWNRTCVPPWKEKELVHKVNSAAKTPSPKERGYLLGPGAGGCSRPRGYFPGRMGSSRCGAAAPVVRDPVVEVDRYLKGFRCCDADWFEASPVRLPEQPLLDGAVLVEALYQPGEWVNFVTEHTAAPDRSGKVKARPCGRGITLERNAVVARFLTGGTDSGEGGGWLRMNPVDGHGIGDANVTAFRFALLESDELPHELQLSLYFKLPLPVAALVTSGGRSVHAWVKVDAQGVDEYRETVSEMLGLLERFGLDGNNKNPSRLSRLPGATRVIGAEGDGRQRLLYLNPTPTGRSVYPWT